MRSRGYLTMEHMQLQLGEVSLHVVAAGQGPVVILLHGFPEFWYSWRSQIPALAAAGLRVIAPDMRGFNLSDKPSGLSEYALDKLVGDVANLIEQQAGGRAFVVGHDWGGVVAWRLAALRPDLARKLAVLNAPHPAAYRRVLANNPLQWLRSSYILFFQIPQLAEWIIRAGDFWLIERAFKRQASPTAFSAADIERYKAALRQTEALTSALNYYRAAFWHSGTLFGPPQIVSVPTLLIWGERDLYLSSQLTRGLDRWVSDLHVARLSNASHWVQNDEPEVVNKLLMDFFLEPAPTIG